MRKTSKAAHVMKARRLVWLGVAAAAMLGCDRSSTAPATREFSYATRVTPSAFHAGDTVTVTVTATNITSHVVVLDTVPCSAIFTVTADNGAVMGPPPTGCLLILYPPQGLAPGAQHVFTQRWTGDATGWTPADPALVPPGQYAVRSTFDAPDALNPSVGIDILP